MGLLGIIPVHPFLPMVQRDGMDVRYSSLWDSLGLSPSVNSNNGMGWTVRIRYTGSLWDLFGIIPVHPFLPVVQQDGMDSEVRHTGSLWDSLGLSPSVHSYNGMDSEDKAYYGTP